jgi:hypothetical protein
MNPLLQEASRQVVNLVTAAFEQHCINYGRPPRFVAALVGFLAIYYIGFDPENGGHDVILNPIVAQAMDTLRERGVASDDTLFIMQRGLPEVSVATFSPDSEDTIHEHLSSPQSAS